MPPQPCGVSGEEYATPLAYTVFEGGCLLLDFFPDAVAEPLWIRNVENDAEVTVEVGERTKTMTPTVLRGGPERDRLYEAACEYGPFVPDCEQTPTRSVPVVWLTPIGLLVG